VCHRDSMLKKLAVLFLAATAALAAQTNWRRVGGSSFEAGLAAPATGPVVSVWFSLDGGKLFSRTLSGHTWETADLESWSRAIDPPPHPNNASAGLRAPENSRTVAGPRGTSYALGANLFRSEDNGRTWINLTGYRGQSVIGAGQNDLAVSPADPRFIVVANAWGVWASHDSGLTWSGLNEQLPNLAISEIQSIGNGVKATLGGLGDSRLTPGATTWEPLGGGPDYASLSKALSATITALTSSGDTAYAGSIDGRIWVSRDKQVSWVQSPNQAGGSVERIYVDPAAPNAAFVASAGRTRSVLRTINYGQFWDDITGSLTENPAHGVAADRSANAIYVATDRGVFLARADLNALGSVSTWAALNGLPDAPARDVKLSGTNIYAAIDGFGLYAASAPLLTGTMKMVSSADLNDRPAAPGALFSLVGGKVQSAKAGSLDVPVLASANEESQIQVPFEATGTQFSVSLRTAATSTVMTVPLRSVSPAIFLDRNETPILMDADTGLTLESKLSLQPRQKIQLLATGLGRTTPAWPTAVPAPGENPPAVTAAVQVFLGGRPIEVTRATLAPNYVGLYLIEIELPAILDAGAADLYLAADGVESNKVRVYLTSGT
jgi:uncharacterized protein (TIGR03437 family)